MHWVYAINSNERLIGAIEISSHHISFKIFYSIPSKMDFARVFNVTTEEVNALMVSLYTENPDPDIVSKHFVLENRIITGRHSGRPTTDHCA